jgi:hypothetical protein
MMFTRYSSLNGRLFIAGAGCMLGNQNCQYIPEWGTGEGDKDKVNASYNPLVPLVPIDGDGQQGRALALDGIAHDLPCRRRVGSRSGWVAWAMFEDQNGQDLFIHLAIFQLPNQILCADLRGYWGDYDDLQALGPVPGRTSNVFARTITDSSQGCSYRWQYTSSQVHVGFTGN